MQEGYWQAIEPTFTKLQHDLELDQQKDMTRFKAPIKELLEEEIVSLYYHQRGRIEH